MEKKFVSAFKINGVPILPPLINDEVRAMINDSRQKAIEIERRILQKRKEAAAAAAAVAAAAAAGNDLRPVKVEAEETSLNSEETITNKADDDDDDDDDDDPLKKHENEQLPTEMVDHRNGHDDHDQSEQTPVEGSSLGDDETPTVICEPDPEVIAEEAHKVDHVEPEIDQLDSCKSKSRSRRSSNCSGSSTSTVNLSVESISNALSEHEKRMKELLKRQEEERMLLERKFREQTEELVALCAKATINGNPPVSLESNGAAVLKTSSTVSMLSLCDISYDSAPDTDTDAAYVTCNNNGTSDELLSGIEEPAANTIDTNGNGGSHSIPLEDSLQRVQRAAIIINAYARGYLTRRLFQTSEVQSIKQTIVDILTFIVNSRNGQGDDLDASLRRNAFKHIAFCLDRLHDVFVNYTPQQRMQMIRRDRYLKRKEAARPRTN
ncbi:hypothetical protein AND_009714 [Anopheles darlingi]|uniref:Uncharacterized protein n=1 Tax=Anopheles darlingi TaxID=43151 RepID=W5J7A7_ANODA|nr:hypothetical protein AND_009714 [Anopheles darlingi]